MPPKVNESTVAEESLIKSSKFQRHFIDTSITKSWQMLVNAYGLNLKVFRKYQKI